MARTQKQLKIAAAAKKAVPKKQRKPKRKAPGTVALAEIRRLQRSTELLIPKKAFERVVREVLEELNPSLRIQANAVSAIQAASEDYLGKLLEDTNLQAVHARRVTITPRDMRHARLSRKEENVL